LNKVNKASEVLPLYIGGKFVDSFKPEKKYDVANPTAPEHILASIGWYKDSVPTIIESMKLAQPAFSRMVLPERLALVNSFCKNLLKNKEELTNLMMLELGRSLQSVQEELNLCHEMFNCMEEFCVESLGEKKSKNGSYWSYAPLGLVLISSNIGLPMFSLLSAALTSLAAGNAVCLKPSVHCPLTTHFLAQTIHESGFPAGIVQIIYGDFDIFRRLALSNQFHTVHCTGGEEVLEQVRRDLSFNQNCRMVLCSAGKNAAIVTEQAMLKEAVASILYGATVDCGQRLESTSLIFLHESQRHQFIDNFVSQIKNMPIFSKKEQKNSLDKTQAHAMGPLCSLQAWERFLRFQGIAARECSETLRWGKAIDNLENGYFVSPGVHMQTLEKVEASVYATNAFFGPDVCIVPYTEIEHVTNLLDSLKSARTVSVHSESKTVAENIRKNVHVPNLVWNQPSTQLEIEIPRFGRGKAGNAYATGMRFLFQTVFPVSFNVGGNMGKVLLVIFSCFFSFLFQQKLFADYRKAVEGNEVVKGKIYPKSERIQVGLGVGGILNQSFLSTTLFGGSGTYHFNEWHALNVDVYYGLSSDKPARDCVETFYFDTKRTAKYGETANCNPDPSNLSEEANETTDNQGNPSEEEKEDYKTRKPFARKPAYMPIRQIDLLAGVNYQWTPVYGKALWFLSTVGYLDFMVNVGAGLAFSTVWPQKVTFPNGDSIKGKGTSEASYFGKDGRPTPVKQTSPTLNLGLGTRFFFAKHFLVNVDFRNVTLIGSNPNGGSDLSNFFTIAAGGGAIF
jgi:outer membrane beta-barrel protein